MKQIFLSIIVPVYNEEDNIKPLIEKIKSALKNINQNYELIFINDGSNDLSESILQKAAANNKFIKVINFTRNFGQTAAFAAGIEEAQGKILATLDADLQNDPDDIIKMLKIMEQEKADVVVGWRKNRHDPFLRSLLSQVANKIINQSTNTTIHDTGCSLRLYKAEVIKNLKLYGEMHRFIPALAAASGAKLIETPVNHQPRKFGHSKYGLSRTFKVLLDLLTVKFLSSFQTKPIYMFGMVGFTFISFSIITAILVVVRKIFLGGVWVSPLFFVMTNFFNVGITCILMGLLAEIQVRSWFESSGKKGYVIKNIWP